MDESQTLFEETAFQFFDNLPHIGRKPGAFSIKKLREIHMTLRTSANQAANSELFSHSDCACACDGPSFIDCDCQCDAPVP